MENSATLLNQLLEGLNDPQRQAVVHADGPLLILAGPGSGKTRVVTRRVAYLAATVTRPRHILAITFTNKAAKEMKERVAALPVPSGMTVCTFHALCAKLLRWHHERAGVARNFTILDRDDRRKIIKEATIACGLDPSNYAPAAVEHVISNAKNDMLGADMYARLASDWKQKTYARIYEQYEKTLHQQSCFDFDDLLMRVAMLLEKDVPLREELQDQYRYVLVDEYQDTNGAQYKIARLLSDSHKNLCVTGDPDQSIYGWRGADIENILRFERDFPGALVVRLEQNYRSTKKILAAADTLIAANTQRKAKSLWTQNADGPAVRVVEFEDAEEESAAIAREIKTNLRNGADAKEIAIFYRVNSLSRIIEEAFLREGLAYQIARGVEFYNRKEIKDVLAYMRVLVNPADQVAMLRVINTPPRGIGDTTVDRLVAESGASGRSVFDTVTGQTDFAALGRSGSKVRDFGQLLRKLHGFLTLPPSEALAQIISHSGLRAHYSGEKDMDDAPTANLDELISAAAEFHETNPSATIVDWLEHAALVSDVDGVRESAGQVTLMTLHAAKGLEFGTVYVIGLEDGLLPFRRRDDERIDEEEERRLCFVGMTRAKARLTLTRSRYRMKQGLTERTVRSPFLDELRRHGVEWIDADDRDRYETNPFSSPARKGGFKPTPRHAPGPDAGRRPSDLDQWGAGTLVRHPTYGLGKVLAIHKGAKRTHVDVLFEDGSKRTWVLEFAELERVDFHDVG